MIRTTFSRTSLVVSLLTFLLAVALVSLPVPTLRGQEKKAAAPWSSSDEMQPAGLAKMLTDKYVSLPTAVFVGFRSLYAGGHVPDASFHGTASTEQGLAELKTWAASLPRSTELVIYCGCCPMDKCPNIRPAYTALNAMGFKKVRVLMLPTSFAADWADKGYPMQKGM
ncbi:MAG TPA: rhodanese-like domain-containing protein [Candidatus Acidoferrum sp.]|nr:rhodanese-like domain-containing protein [Candidatus Acidoferrum sp.]